jgi:hypothetical protein
MEDTIARARTPQEDRKSHPDNCKNLNDYWKSKGHEESREATTRTWKITGS